MRTQSLLLLVVAFLLGLASAFAAAFLVIDAKPTVAVVEKGPTIKILVAGNDIALGAEIMGTDLIFADVPIDEIPIGALTTFADAYGRRPAYPIPAGCPICEDLLMPKESQMTHDVKYIPPGSQIVSLEVEQYWLGETATNAAYPLSQLFVRGDTVDIRVMPREDGRGEYVERKKWVLQKYASRVKDDSDKTGRTILKNIPIHEVHCSGGTSTEVSGKQLQTITLLLENAVAEKLSAATRDGRLRVVPNSAKMVAARANGNNGNKSGNNTESVGGSESPMDAAPKTATQDHPIDGRTAGLNETTSPSSIQTAIAQTVPLSLEPQPLPSPVLAAMESNDAPHVAAVQVHVDSVTSDDISEPKRIVARKTTVESSPIRPMSGTNVDDNTLEFNHSQFDVRTISIEAAESEQRPDGPIKPPARFVYRFQD